MVLNEDAYLEHHGILGQRWGVRRFQNADGSYKSAGKIRYSQASRKASGSGHIKEQHRSNVQAINDMNISQKKKDKMLAKEDQSYKKALQNQDATDKLKWEHEKKMADIDRKYNNSLVKKYIKDSENADFEKSMRRQEDINNGKSQVKKALAIAGGVALTAAVAYGGYKLYKNGALDNILNQKANMPTKSSQSKTSDPYDLLKQMGIDSKSSNGVPTQGRSSKPSISSPIGQLKASIDPSTGEGYKKDKVYDMVNGLVQKGDSKYLGAKNFVTAWGGGGKAQQYHEGANFSNNLWNKVFSAGERNGVREYTGNAYRDINSLLRTGKLYYPSSNKSETQMLIDQATSALEKSRLKDDTILHRGIGNALPSVLGLSSDQAKALKTDPSSIIGRTFTDRGFGSSGIAQDDAWSGVKMHIFAPAGTKGMYVDPISKHKGEHEVLLQRNTSYVVKSLTKNADGTITDIFVDIIDQALS